MHINYKLGFYCRKIGDTSFSHFVMTQISLNFTNELHSHLIVYFFIGLNLTIIVIIVSFTTVHFQ